MQLPPSKGYLHNSISTPSNINSLVMAASRYCKKSYVHASFHAITLTLLLLAIPHAASLSFNYQQLGDTGIALNFSGKARRDNDVINLTRSEPDSYGRVTYYELLHLWDKNSEKVTDFTTHFSFTINTPNKTHHGDGITSALSI